MLYMATECWGQYILHLGALRLYMGHYILVLDLYVSPYSNDSSRTHATATLNQITPFFCKKPWFRNIVCQFA